MKLLHTADWHLSPNRSKLEESTRCIEHLIGVAEAERPDVAVIAGDLFDFHDGAIRIDSETTRAAIRLVQSLALVCPVLIVRGTPSHDREGLDFLREIWTQHPVHVATTFGQVALVKHGADLGYTWEPLGDVLTAMSERPFLEPPVAAFTLCPSPEKVWLMAQGVGSIREANANARELLFDLFNGFGAVNAGLPVIPTVLVGHLMVTGAQLSSGISAVGEDLEAGVSDLRAANCQYVALGHVHACQNFGQDIWYSGSPGRMNFGEKEEKGFLMVDVIPGGLPQVRVIPTPARRFVFGEATWGDAGADGIRAEVARLAAEDLTGAGVRFRFAVPEEHLHELVPEEIRAQLLAAGAREAKVERSIIPRERVRAAGISRLETLPEKVAKWGQTVGTEIPVETLSLAAAIEGMDPEEIAAAALARVDHAGDATDMIAEEDPFAAPPAAVSMADRRERILGAIDGFVVRQEEQAAAAVAAMRGPVQETMF